MHLNSFEKMENYSLTMLRLFAANINWNAETGRVYVYTTECSISLDNNEQYLQPLRKRGIKVLLGVLGNHDEAGVCQLSIWAVSSLHVNSRQQL